MTKMIIGIDGNEANVEKRVGISEYAFELLKQFSSSKFINSTAQRLKFIIYLKDKPRNDLPSESQNLEYRIIGPRKLWTQIALPLGLLKDCRLKGRQINVFFSPTHYAPRFSPVPTAISIMDMSFIKYPEMFTKKDLFQLQNWTKYSAKNASLIFTISQSSKNDIIKVYKVPEKRVIVTYPGIKKISNIKYQISNMDKLRNKYGIEGDYVLFVGTIQPRKNIVRLIEAFSMVLNNTGKNTLQLILLGKKGWLYEEILQAPTQYGVVNNVKFLDFVPDEDLPAFYQQATCFVLPSLYEGFGLPVLEAMQNGCPVIISNVSSLPEAGGDAAFYVDPLNTSDIAQKITKVLDNEKLRIQLREKGYKQVKKFSWDYTAKETLRALEKVVNT